ncbi:hypothetical protein [Hylemonella gracilis]|uniref:hypothetical protein n=1 Tax=Hylemonella gracilis TaxID=80880 RepID=UPI0009DAF486|nr:hypothetical protein [Hylemonella gracilis]
MNYSEALLKDIARLLDLLAPHCSDHETIDWLRAAVSDRGKWQKAHGVFSRIRSKSLKAERSGKARESAQYLFEEVCAKTLFNLSGSSGPFDIDSPYWIVPNAIAFARQAGLADAEILACVTFPRVTRGI